MFLELALRTARVRSFQAFPGGARGALGGCQGLPAYGHPPPLSAAQPVWEPALHVHGPHDRLLRLLCHHVPRNQGMRLLGEGVVVHEVAWSSFCPDTRTGCLVAGMSGDTSPARLQWDKPGGAVGRARRCCGSAGLCSFLSRRLSPGLRPVSQASAFLAALPASKVFSL